MRDMRVDVDGHSIRYLDVGSGSAVVLLHGLGGYADKWGMSLKHLSQSHRVIAPDMIGCGRSDKPVADYTPEFFVDFVKRFLGAIRVKRPHLVGVSLGGHIASIFAAKYPRRLSKLVLISPAGIMKMSTPALDAYIMAALYPRPASVGHALQMMEGSKNIPRTSLITSFVTNMRRPNAKMAFMSSLLCFKNAEDLTPHLKKIKAQTLLLWGHEDPIIPVSYASQFRAAIPSCKFIEIKNCGHTPYVQHPKQFSRLVADFLSDVDVGI